MSVLDKTTSRSSWPLAVLGGVLFAYLVSVALFGRLLCIDDIFYKAAGVHWAFEGRFAAPELVARMAFDPPINELFACYPPLYPFLFGLVCKVFGFGYAQLSLFDGVFRVLLCITVAYVVVKMRPAGSSFIPAVLAALAVLPLGWIGRPDDLAVIFGLLAASRLLPEARAGRDWQAGILLGFSAATSLVAAGVFAAIVSGLVLGSASLGWVARLRMVVVMGAVSAAVLIGTFVPLLFLDPTAWRQIVDHGMDNMLEGGVLETWSAVLHHGLYLIVATVAAVVAALWLGPAAMRGGMFATWLRWFPAALLMLGVLFLNTAGKFLYLWFAGPWLVAACVTMVAELRNRNAKLLSWGPAAAVLAAGCVYGGQFWVVERLVVADIPKERRIESAAARVQEIVPPGATVLAFDHWLTLALRNDVRDFAFNLLPECWGDIDYIVLTGNGSGAPGAPQILHPGFREYAAEHFELIDDRLAREPLRLFGVRITNSAYGWGAAIYRRKTPEVAPVASERP